jgi:hypothetical protein
MSQRWQTRGRIRGRSYRIKDIVETLEEKCEANERDPKRIYVWIDCLCNNPHRVDEDVSFEESRDIFGTIVTNVGTMWSMMKAPWDDPEYLKRVWCNFEMFTAIQYRQSARQKLSCLQRKEGHD